MKSLEKQACIQPTKGGIWSEGYRFSVSKLPTRDQEGAITENGLPTKTCF